jgi:hypothetical protein
MAFGSVTTVFNATVSSTTAKISDMGGNGSLQVYYPNTTPASQAGDIIRITGTGRITTNVESGTNPTFRLILSLANTNDTLVWSTSDMDLPNQASEISLFFEFLITFRTIASGQLRLNSIAR